MRIVDRFTGPGRLALLVMVALGLFGRPALSQLLLDDPLQGSTSGTRSGGTFANGGWQVTGSEDYIYWHLSHSVNHGAAEFYVKGINPNQVEKNEHFHMYDYTYGSADTVYDGYRNNPYKMYIRKTGTSDAARANSCEVVYAANGDFFESDSGILSWDPATNYKMRVEWGPEGGNTRLTLLRDGAQFFTQAIVGDYTPTGHSVRIAKCRGLGEGAQPGAVYSYLKVWDLTNYIPSPPTVTLPANGATNKSSLVYIAWNGDSHTDYQVRICGADNPDNGIVWDSGQVASTRNFAWTGALGNLTNYYVYVRIGNAGSWSGWSASGRWFRVDNSYAGGSNIVRVSGRSYEDANGPMLGLGFTYMAGLWMCKNDRAGFQNELDFMRQRGFTYQRILSEVPGACSQDYWWGRGVQASTFQCSHGVWGYPWSDYDQQLKDCIDIAYDTYGIRTEVTIFGGAGESFPNYPGKQAHCQRVLDDLVGREHKVQLIEVANEGFATGVSDADLRSLGQYLADRTSIPIALSCPGDRSAAGLIPLYAGSAADVATVHFERYLGSSEGHWLPVRDPWYVADLYPTIPPVSSNEPIGPGSSVNTEDDPIHLVSAAAFAYIANLNSYVWHSRAGVRHDYPFGNYAGVGQMHWVKDILPPDVSSWIRNDGKESAAPFTVYCNGAPNTYWTDNGAGSDGCHRNIGGRKGIEFVCYPQGIRSGGLTLQARQQVTFRVYNPLTGDVVVDTTTKNTGEQLLLPQGPEAYIIKGAYGPYLPGQASKTLMSKGPRTLTIDGNSSDWNVPEFTTLVRGGQSGSGDTALIGFDGASRYYGSYSGVLPTSAADHTARIYSRNDASYLYFLVRCDDSDMRYSAAADLNWQNDCVEFYIDPAHAGGGAPISNSTSDIQLVIDANNQKNVYCTTSPYATQILNGTSSAVVRDGTGWWLEVRISKTALDPDIATGQTIGLDFNFRDNDNNNDAALTTIYTWNDSSYQGFPSKVPNNWGDLFLDNYQTPYSGVIQIPGTIQAENYDVGGENISYHDTTPNNEGGQYRSDGVDIEACSDTGGGYDVGYTNPGEWLEYTVNVATEGDYNIKARVSSAAGGGTFRVLVDGADLTGLKAFDSTGGWQNWATIIAPARHLTAAQHILRLSMENAGLNVNYLQVESLGADAVSEDLGATNYDDGMTHVSLGDGNTIDASIGGHFCRRNATPGSDAYMYFTVADTYAYQGSKPSVDITVEYYDAATGILTLNYDAIGSVWKDGPSVNLTNTNTWKTFNFHVNDAYFGNRENYGADFRIARSDGATFYLDTVTVSTGPADTTPPGNVTAFTATPGDLANALSWTNPTDPDFSGVKIMFKTTGYPAGPADGNQAFDGPGTTALHAGLTNGVAYYYRAFAHDTTPNYASGVQASAVPVEMGAPDNISGFTAVSGDRQNVLSWTNPASGYTGIKIMFKTTGYPTSQADGTQIYNSNGTSYTHTGLTNGITYYYKAFAHDAVPNYASGALASAVPAGPVTISNSTFDSDANGWALTTWKFSSDPTVIPQMVWTAGAGNPGGAVRCIGAGDTDSDDRCLREGGEMAKVISTVGTHDIQVSYDLRVNSLGRYSSGVGSGGNCAPDHGVVDEQLTVFYSTNGGTTWTEAEYLLRAALLDYQSYGRRTINLTTISAANGNAGFALRFRWQLNHTSDIVDLDNVTVSGFSAIPVDTTPPGPVTGFSATPNNGRNALAWTNPADPDFAGTMIRYNTTGYPTSVTDGTWVCTRAAVPGSNDSYNHTGLTNGVRRYYSAFAYDGVPNYAGAVNASGLPAADSTIPAAKALTNGQVRALRGNVVSAMFADGFYIQDPVNPWGIKVTGSTATSVGTTVDLIGVIGGQGAERYIDCTGSPIWAAFQDPVTLHPRVLGNRGLGGGRLNASAPGVYHGEGANNLGLLVRVFGTVVQKDNSLGYFYIDDGARLWDMTIVQGGGGVPGAPHQGIRVKADGTAYPYGSYVSVTGISSCFDNAGTPTRQILPVAGGIQILKQ